MTDCERLSERMPEVAGARAAWNLEEKRHIADCEHCRREWELVQRVSRLGAAPLGIDDARVTANVLRRLRETPAGPTPVVSRRRAWVWAAVAATAAAVVTLWTGRMWAPEPPSLETARLELSVPELEDLDLTDLDTVVKLLDQPFRAEELVEFPSWGETESRALDRGFNTVEVQCVASGLDC